MSHGSQCAYPPPPTIAVEYTEPKRVKKRRNPMEQKREGMRLMYLFRVHTAPPYKCCSACHPILGGTGKESSQSPRKKEYHGYEKTKIRHRIKNKIQNRKYDME